MPRATGAPLARCQGSRRPRIHTSSTGSRSSSMTGSAASSRSSRPLRPAIPRPRSAQAGERRLRWLEKDDVRWLEADLPGAKAAFSTRIGGVSEPPFDTLNLGRLTGDPEVRENRHRLATALGVDAHGVLMGRQVHEAEVRRHDGPTQPNAYADPAPGLPDADGHATDRPGLAPLVFVADCLPVALAGAGGVAMIHCGWRGMAAGIVRRGVEEVSATAAAIGPSIGPCCYEVGDEVL